MSKIAIVGAGHVGATAGLYLGLVTPGELVLIDSDGDKAEALALDLGQALALIDKPCAVRGGKEHELLEGADVVVIAAGHSRKPGMSRTELLNVNLPIVTGIARSIAQFSPYSIVIVISNPLDEMTYAAWKAGGFPSRGVMGMAGVLDNARFKYFIAREMGEDRGLEALPDIDTFVLGSHGDTMVPLLDSSRVEDRPLGAVFDDETISRLEERTRGAGAEIVSLLKSGSAYFAPAVSLGMMVEAVLEDKREVLPVTAYLEGEYGLEGIFIGVPARLGREGVVEVLELDLSEMELKRLHEAAEAVRQRVESMKVEG